MSRKEIEANHLVVASVLSGNRNFEGRVHAEVRANFLASPPLVVAYALLGRVDRDLTTEPVGYDRAGQPVHLKDIWPTREEVRSAVEKAVKPEMFRQVYADVFTGDKNWQSLPVPAGATYAWDGKSTYVQSPPYFDGMTMSPPAVTDIAGARVLALLGDSITTDHISPAGSIKAASPAGKYLVEHGVQPKDFNSYGSRRGNHEVMMRGTFANVRLKNLLAPGTEGGVTRHLPDGEEMSIFDAAMKYAAEGTPLRHPCRQGIRRRLIARLGRQGAGLLGVRAVIAESYERIHRSNLVGMGVLPLQFQAGENAASLGLNGEEVYSIDGLAKAIESGFAAGRKVTVRAKGKSGEKSFQAIVRIDTPQEVLYYKDGGILQYVLRQLAGRK